MTSTFPDSPHTQDAPSTLDPPVSQVDKDFFVLVSVGTDLHPYNRLISWMDQWADTHPNARVVIQRGTSDDAEHAETYEQIEYPRLVEMFGSADVVVCHGGPSTVMDARRQGRKPIVVGRNPDLGEHVDGHQLAFAEHLQTEDLAVVVDRQDALFAALDLAKVAPEQFAIDPQDTVPPGVTRFGQLADELITKKLMVIGDEDSPSLVNKVKTSGHNVVDGQPRADDLEHLEDQSVSVVVATRHRPVLVRRAIESILAQDHGAPIQVVLVFDQCESDESLRREDPFRSVVVATNNHAPGLAGARNSGIELATNNWIAWCDDDDEWLEGKLAAQFAALAATPSARAACTGIYIQYEGADTKRIPDADRVNLDGFLEDRIAAVHPSAWLVHRDTLVDRVGLVDENLPGSYAEDYDMFLRTSRVCPIAVAEAPLVRVWWHGASYFFERWKTIDEALEYLLNKHPEFENHPKGMARICGQRAVAQAAMGHRRQALATIAKTLRHNPLERRVLLALAVIAGIYPGTVLKAAHRFGRGI